MSEQIEASASTIIKLTEDISDCIVKISTLNTELSDQLEKLRNTFKDEDYKVIQGYVSNSQTKIEAAVPDLKIVMDKLIEYAELLKKTHKAIT